MKKFDPTKVFEFSVEVHQDEIDLGTTVPTFETITKFTSEWCPKMDIFLLLEQKIHGYTDRYIELIQQRGFTFEEFLELYNHNILEKDFYNHKIFEYFKIEVESERFIFLQKLDENKKDAYVSLILNSPFLESMSFFFDKLPAKLAINDLKMHSYIVGASGSGKSELMRLLIYNLQKNYLDCSILLLDPHGDLASDVYKCDLNKETNRVVYIDPLFRKGYTPVYNPFDIHTQDLDEISVLAQNMQEVIELMLGDEVSKVMESVLNPCITTLLLKGNSNFYDLARFFDTELNNDLIQLGMQSPFLPHRDAIAKIKSGYYSRTRESIMGRIQNFRNQAVFDRMTAGRSTFDLGKLLESNKIVLFSLPLGLVGNLTLQYIGRFILSQVVNLGLRRANQPKESRRTTFVLVDECQNFITPSVAKAYEQLRKYGIHFVLASQYVEQLRELQESVIANSNIKIIGYTDSKDTKTKLTTSTETAKSDLDSLKKHEFYCKVRGKPGYKFKPSTMLIGGSCTLSLTDQDKLDQAMLSKYYNPIEYVQEAPKTPKIPTTQQPKAPFDLHIPDDTASQ